MASQTSRFRGTNAIYSMAETRKKSEKRQRNIRRTFRMNEEELNAFLVNCESANLNAGDLFRLKCCSHKPLRKYITRREDQEIYVQILAQVMKGQYRLSRLDNNVNQMARALNVATLNLNGSQVAQIFEQHKNTLQKLLTLYEEYVEVSNESRDLLREKLMR